MKNWTKKNVFLLLAGILLISSCAIKDPVPNNNSGAIDKALSESIRSNNALEASGKNGSNLPLTVQSALMPEISIPHMPNNSSFNVDPEQRFDIAVNNVPTKDFFIGLVKNTKYNMAISPEVGGKISLELKSVTIPQTMEAVRDLYGFEYERTSYGYTVFPRRLETRVFNVNYLDIDRNGQSQTTIGSGQITSTVQNTLTATGVTTSQQSGSTPSGLIQTSSSSKFWELLKENLETIIGTEDGRSIVVNPRSGTIIVKAYPNELRYVASYLDKVQNIIQRQVVIEAKILEIELKAQFQSGINWKLLGLQQGFTTSGSDDTGASLITTTELPTTFNSIFKAEATYGGTFNSLINLLNDQGTVNVLSSPRVATINNQKAVIKVGKDSFFVTDVSSDTNNTSGGSTTTADITLTPFFSGISLDVTPQIDENDYVTMHIHPIISNVVKDIQKFTVNNLPQELPLASSTVRESDSVVRAKNGQVIVIGGLMESSGGDYSAATPGADNLPGIGGLFKNKNKTARKFELVILLKPVIAESTKTWQQQLQEAANTAKKMSNIGNDFNYKLVPAKRKKTK